MAKERSNRARGPAPRLVLYGRHAVTAALANPDRRARRLHATREALADLAVPDRLELRTTDARGLELLLGRDVPHQGLALEVEPLPPRGLEEALWGTRPVLALDQVTDPRNLGAILRSAAAFEVAAVILPERHSAELNGACAKAASGAVDIVPIITVTNLARALEELAAAGLEVIGLDAAADQTIDQVTRGARPAIVLGSEGEGLRRLVRERCTRLVRLPISPRIESLNVSVAAGIALYALARPGGVA